MTPLQPSLLPRPADAGRFCFSGNSLARRTRPIRWELHLAGRGGRSVPVRRNGIATAKQSMGGLNMRKIRKIVAALVVAGSLVANAPAADEAPRGLGLVPVEKDRKAGATDRKLHGTWIHQSPDARRSRQIAKVVRFQPNQRFLYIAVVGADTPEEHLLGISGTYSVSHGKVTLTPDPELKALGTFEFDYSVKGDQLVLSIDDDSSTAFTRQADGPDELPEGKPWNALGRNAS
jgi:hypothetical protein